MRIPTLIGLAAGAALVGASLAPAAATIKPVANGPAFQRVVPDVISRSQLHLTRPAAVPVTIQRRAGKIHVPAGVRKGFRHDGASNIYLTDDSGYIFQLNKKGTTVLGYATDCSGAEGAKVDHSGNLWVACTNTSTVNEYTPASSGTASLVLTDNPGGIDYYTADVAVDNAGNVYATSLYAFSCTSTCFFYPGQVSKWSAPVTPSSVPVTVADPNINEEGFFLDVDTAGNVYVDYDSCGTSFCGYGLDQITGSGVNNLISYTSGSIQFPGGVYVTQNGNVNLIDQIAGTETQYIVSPFGPAGFAVSIQYNLQHGCDPVSGGWSKGDKKIGIGDAGCHALQLGKATNGNTLTGLANINFSLPIGAAFAPSDK